MSTSTPAPSRTRKLGEQECGTRLFNALQDAEEPALLLILMLTQRQHYNIWQRVGYEDGDVGGDGGGRSYGGCATWFDHGDKLGYSPGYWMHEGESFLHFAMDAAIRRLAPGYPPKLKSEEAPTPIVPTPEGAKQVDYNALLSLALCLRRARIDTGSRTACCDEWKGAGSGGGRGKTVRQCHPAIFTWAEQLAESTGPDEELRLVRDFLSRTDWEKRCGAKSASIHRELGEQAVALMLEAGQGPTGK